MISVIAVWNDAGQFESMLQASLHRQQRQTFELIALDNRQGMFRSAAQALNEGARRASGDYLFFAHQDVQLHGEDWLSDAEGYLRALSSVGIAGVAGARPAPDASRREIVSNIEDSVPPQRVGHVAFTAPQAVETVDECAFFVPRTVFERVRFDEVTCDGWHLYAVDFSLAARAAGLGVYALPLPLYHRSGGAVVSIMGFETFEGAYFRALRRIVSKHAAGREFIYTTCGAWSTRRSVLRQRFPLSDVRRAVLPWMRAQLKLRS